MRSAKGHLWQPGAGGMGLHTILLDPKNPARIFVAISAAGTFRTDDAGKTWKPITGNLKDFSRIANQVPGLRVAAPDKPPVETQVASFANYDTQAKAQACFQ